MIVCYTIHRYTYKAIREKEKNQKCKMFHSEEFRSEEPDNCETLSEFFNNSSAAQNHQISWICNIDSCIVLNLSFEIFVGSDKSLLCSLVRS